VTTRIEHDVVIAGGGPTGLMLGAELALAGVDALIVERRPTQELDGSRSRGLHARTIEVLDMRGVADRFLAEGQAMQTQGFAYVPLDISDFPSRHPHGLALLQGDVERILAGWVDELGGPIRRGSEVVDFTQDAAGVEVELSDGTVVGASFLVGCDGGRSLVRKQAGIDFPGVGPSTSAIIAEVEMTEEPVLGIRPEGGGIGPVDPTRQGGPYGVTLLQPFAGQSDTPTLDDLRDALVDAYGTDFGAHSPRWISRFTDAARQAATYRSGRVILAGDAAHIHSPHGGQGLNTGVQDAVNLGWKLAQVVHGTSPESLLDTYHDERHPVAARVLQNTMAQVALTTPDPRHQALLGIVRDLLAMDEPRRHIAAMLTGLDIRYDLGEGHPLLGRRLPDVELRTADRAVWVSALLREARPILIDLGSAGDVDLAPWAGRVRSVAATYDGVWELPVIGEVTAPRAVLVRPDGHVAWVGDLEDASLTTALTRWFGDPNR
jgi:2-polyprenyl-6-methoxyphenol hydroxylase-like FAD-dependent oxidoreductase